MHGYGSPSSGSLSPDRGYGSPSTYTTTADLGYGSHRITRYIPVVIGGSTIGDSGGIVIRLRMGEWPHNGREVLEARSGPFTVRIVDAVSGQIYPRDRFGCHSTRLGGGHACETDLRHEVLTFECPPLPTGSYHIDIYYGGPGLPYKIRATSALTVVLRGRNSHVYAGRAVLPSRWTMGARLAQLEPPLLDDYAEWPHGIARVITGVIAESMQALYGRPQTLLRQAVTAGDTSVLVETTLGFPPQGTILLGRVRWTYTSVQTQPFVGAGYEGPSVPAKTMVSLDVTALLPS